MSPDSVLHMLQRVLKRAGLPRIRFHDLRHTFATMALQNGVDVRTLQEVLGHDHLNTTQIYPHVDNDDLRAAARANPLAGVKKRRKVLDSGENNDNRKE